MNGGDINTYGHPGLRRTTTRPLATLTLILLAAPAIVQAQETRHGVWWDLVGLGFGAAGFSCHACTGNPTLGGWTLSFAAGGTLSPHVRLGADAHLWSNGLKADKPLPGIITAGLSLSYYQRDQGGPFVFGGGGLSHYEACKGTGNPIDPCSSDPFYSSGSGWGWTFGAGWEIPNGQFAVKPLLAFHHGAIGTLHSPDGAVVATHWRQNLLMLELRFGLANLRH